MGNRFLILLCVSVGVVLSRPSGQAVPEVNTQRQDVVRAEDDPFILALPVKHKDAQAPGTANQIEPSDAVSDKSPDEPTGDDLIISVDPEAAQRAADDSTVSQAVADGQGNNENEAYEETDGILGEVNASPSQVDDVEVSETAHANEEVGLSASAAEENEQGTVAENAAQQPVDEGVTAEDQVSSDHQEGGSEKSLDQATIGEQNAADITFVEKVPRGQDIPAEFIISAVEGRNVATLIEEEQVPAEAAAVEEQNIAESTDVETQESGLTETAAAEASEAVQNDAESVVAEESAAVADQNPAEAEVNSAVKEPNTAEVATELEQHEEQQNVEKRTPEQEPAEEPHAEQEPAETEVSEQSQVDEQRSQPKNAEEAEEQKNAETNEEQQAQKSQNAEEERAQEPKTEQQTEEQ
ncbi:RNA polymerase II degradation factor 1-like [Penaeus chinensis]|uniref:RNA polymerase II degradation factor 1-like n=1 Tax=Penaeus chinensis TaxID=139456 RepID=UPI001FB5D140|nr:RNA polymerase II degradation factor 1-like [Penaeus chinensis]